MSSQLPEYFESEYTREQIDTAVKRLGEEVTPWARQVYQESGDDILCIPILRGGIFFFTDLVREIGHSIELAPVKTEAYEPGQNEVSKAEVKVSMEGVEPTGRSVLLCDDICDSGRTLDALQRIFLQQGAAEVRSAVLIKRELDTPTFDPEYVGFNYEGPEWFVGYGMEDGDRYRNLPGIYTIRK
jgi:hypoxanthine phosphoribosyltransferase